MSRYYESVLVNSPTMHAHSTLNDGHNMMHDCTGFYMAIGAGTQTKMSTPSHDSYEMHIWGVFPNVVSYFLKL